MNVKEESVELKTHISRKKVALILYCVAFIAYLVYGLQPVDASNYNIDNELVIPDIGLITDVTSLTLDGNKLNTPDTIVGSYSQAKNKTLLIGHSSTVLGRLRELNLDDVVRFNEKTYRIVSIATVLKSNVDMNKILEASDKDTVVLMTCAGKDLGNGDASHRLIVTAIR